MWMMLSGAAGHMEREPQAYAAALATAQSAGGKHADQIALGEEEANQRVSSCLCLSLSRRNCSHADLPCYRSL